MMSCSCISRINVIEEVIEEVAAIEGKHRKIEILDDDGGYDINVHFQSEMTMPC